MGPSSSGTKIGLVYELPESGKVMKKKYAGSDNIFHVCLRMKKNSNRNFLYRIVAEVETEKMADVLCEFLNSKPVGDENE